MRHRDVEQKTENTENIENALKLPKLQPSKTRSGKLKKIIADNTPRKHQGGGKTYENQMKQLKKTPTIGEK